MWCITRLIFILIVFLKLNLCFELIDEKSWKDKNDNDNFYDYKELRDGFEEFRDEVKGFNNNLDTELFGHKSSELKIKKIHHNNEHMEAIESQKRRLAPNIVNIFLDTVKSVVGPIKNHHNKNETSKGIDILFNDGPKALPAFGNNQDAKIILLGTKWCGSGDNARDANDIGYFYLLDHCCREHDLCDEHIQPNGEKYGLKNAGKFTRTGCECEDKFYKCLKRVNTLLSTQIGILYFNILGHQCYKKDHKIIGCNSRIKGRCVDWKKDTKSRMFYQWFDNRWF